MITDTLSYGEALFIVGPFVGLILSLFLLIKTVGDYMYRRRRGQNGPIRIQCWEAATAELIRTSKLVLLVAIAWHSLNQAGNQVDISNPVVDMLFAINWLIVAGSVSTYLFRRVILGMLEDLAAKRARIKRIGGKW